MEAAVENHTEVFSAHHTLSSADNLTILQVPHSVVAHM
jgi:hypothetical protein